MFGLDRVLGRLRRCWLDARKQRAQQRAKLPVAYAMEENCTVGAGTGFGKYTREVAAAKAAAKHAPKLRTNKNGERLTPDELSFISRSNGRCPDCYFGELIEGPHGGLSINMYCANPDCGSRFNDTGPFGWDRISDASPKRKSTVDGQ